MCKASPAQVRYDFNKEAGNTKYNDQGFLLTNRDMIRGFTHYAGKLIEVDWNHPESLVHEFCHWFNPFNPKKCDNEVHW